MLRLITLAALFNTSTAKYYDSSPIVPMSQYTKAQYRILDCNECIQAEGKMCTKADGSSNIGVTGSSNQGHGTCCNPANTTDAHCQSKGDYICSEPILKADNTEAFANIMTDGKNMQMIAYCPLIAPAKCGLKDATSHKVDATTKGKIHLVNETKIVTKKGTAKSGEYDACYWELDASSIPVGSSIQITFKTVRNIQSYLYGGASRALATTSVVEGNVQLKAGDIHMVMVETGAMITALPIDGEQDTEIEFEWEVITTPADNTGMIIGIVVGVLAGLLICCAVMKIRKNKQDNTVQVLAQESVEEAAPSASKAADDTNTVELK